MKVSVIQLLLMSMLFMSCSNDKSSSNSNEITLELTSNDQMRYDKAKLNVRAGQKVTLVLRHAGKMKKSVMGHNFVLLKPKTDLVKFANLAAAAKGNDYIPAGNDVIAHTKMIGGGESTTITFDAPPKGTYDYICSFPAHYMIMKGKFIVE